MTTALSAYSWYEDDELLSLLDRYVGRSSDALGAGRRLKVWLARSESAIGLPAATPEDAALPRPDSDGFVWLTREQAAAKIEINAKTLANYGKAGPPYESWPFVRYRLDLLEAWIQRRKSAPSRRGRRKRI